MTSAPSPLLAALRRYWVLLLIFGVIFAGAGAAWALTRPVQYTSIAKVLVNPLIGTPFSGQSTGKATDNSLQTERVLATAADTLTEASKRSGLSLATLRAGVSAQVPSSTQILQVSFSSGDPAVARKGAQAVADAYLARRKAAATAEIASRTASLKGEQEQTQKELVAAAKKLAGLSAKDVAGTKAAQADLAERTTHATELLSQASQLRQTSLDAGSVIEPASTPTTASRLFDVVTVGAALVVGLLVGLGLALLRTMTDRRIRGPEDVANELVLAHVPTGNTDLAEPVSATGVGSEAEEAYRKLRIAVLAATGRPSVITIASVGSPLAAAAAGANLAVSATHTGASVVVVDASPECGRSGAWALLRTAAGPGLTEALAEGAPVAALLQRSEWGPQVLTPGNDLTRMGTAALPSEPDSLLAQLRSAFDYVIVIAPSPTSPTGEALAAASDACVLVVTADVTHRRAVADARRQLETVRANVLGAVLLDRRRAEPPPVVDPAARARHNANQPVEGRRR
jgi:polysaccharide biosynthesis transport protein